MRLIILLIPILSVTHSLLPMNLPISVIPNDVVALIISRPDMAALDKVFAKQINNNQCTLGNKLSKEIILYKQTRNALIPCFNLLLTCTIYYNDSFKNKVTEAIAARHFPQGIMLFLLPKSMQVKTFRTIPCKAQVDQSVTLSLCQQEKAVEQLATLCIQENKITHDQIIAATEALTGTFNNIIYSELDAEYLIDAFNEDILYMNVVKSFTLIEYLDNIILSKLVLSNHPSQFYDSAIKNIFIMIDYLCVSEKIDLALPIAIISNLSIESNLSRMYQIEENRLRNEPFSRIQLLSRNAPAKSIYARPAEHQHVIKALVEMFLFPKNILLLEKEVQREKILQRAEQQRKNFRYWTKITLATIMVFIITCCCVKKFVH